MEDGRSRGRVGQCDIDTECLVVGRITRMTCGYATKPSWWLWSRTRRRAPIAPAGSQDFGSATGCSASCVDVSWAVLCTKIASKRLTS